MSPLNDLTVEETISFRMEQLAELTIVLEESGPAALEVAIDAWCPVARAQVLEVAVACLCGQMKTYSHVGGES